MVWLQRPSNRLHIERLREIMVVNEHRRLILFLGAGLSFGSSRRGRKGPAEYEQWGQTSVDRGRNDRGRDDNRGESRSRSGRDGASGGDDVDHVDLVTNDDDEPFPTWGRLKSRMRQNLLRVPGQDQSSISRFFRTSDPLDSAQLFRNIVGDANYFDFLRRQFQPRSPVDYWVTPSHDELVALDLPIIFTTNYDNLIERAYAHHGMSLTVSSTAQDFIAHLNPKPERHLVKIHGTIDAAQTVVLTRDDYARARLERKRVYEHLRFDLEQTAYVFVGFSLSDPNVNMLLDDARLETGGTLPPAYTVQGKYDRATDEYYRSMGINVVWIGNWDYLPSFLHAINPKYSIESAAPGAFPV
jgi:SIR2-like protein